MDQVENLGRWRLMESGAVGRSLIWVMLSFVSFFTKLLILWLDSTQRPRIVDEITTAGEVGPSVMSASDVTLITCLHLDSIMMRLHMMNRPLNQVTVWNISVEYLRPVVLLWDTVQHRSCPLKKLPWPVAMSCHIIGNRNNYDCNKCILNLKYSDFGIWCSCSWSINDAVNFVSTQT